MGYGGILHNFEIHTLKIYNMSCGDKRNNVGEFLDFKQVPSLAIFEGYTKLEVDADLRWVIETISEMMIQVDVGGHSTIPLGTPQLSLLVFQFP